MADLEHPDITHIMRTGYPPDDTISETDGDYADLAHDNERDERMLQCQKETNG